MKKRHFYAIQFLLSTFLFSRANVSTPNGVVSQIKKQVTCNWMDKITDIFKTGYPGSKIKSVAVCMFAEMGTLKKANFRTLKYFEL